MTQDYENIGTQAISITWEPGNTGKPTILITCDPGNTGKRSILITCEPGNSGKRGPYIFGQEHVSETVSRNILIYNILKYH